LAAESAPAVVRLNVPCKPEFVGIARLTVLGVAGRMPFSYDEVEDVRLAVGEACTMAVERAIKANKTETDISIVSTISGERLTIEVSDHAGRGLQQALEFQESSDPAEEVDEQGLGALLMELLVDEFSADSTEDGTLVRIVKYAGQV
jgi:serine/threonine-protein kinase RsbW